MRKNEAASQRQASDLSTRVLCPFRILLSAKTVSYELFVAAQTTDGRPEWIDPPPFLPPIPRSAKDDLKTGAHLPPAS